MAEPLKKPTLYDTDFHAWTLDQAAKLRARAHNGIDWDHAAEEIESLGHSEESELESRLSVLVIHLLKWRFQPDERSGSWKGTIIEQRYRIGRRMRRSPSLKSYPRAILAEEYAYARQKAALETGLAESAFPPACPFAIEEILDPDFYPEAG
ncbi:hypothetical protein GCM10011390_44880 [Aureimonas endophytica]|uniref:DUF29 domain-containing protein n=1 Tax=Aureimonas endophytica TaxID=2027858 RepID=A0A917A161_9HYPH|nr:DUF29 domain-containing protein [Aureimonas endophytica]GGE20608.1 hypothetical protein GCM10011390_44880 [Aureimonas endophytica]